MRKAFPPSGTPEMSKRGLTLTELLVVISIIALLIAILLPVLASSRESARRAQCGSNQRQFLISSTDYAIENDGAFATVRRDLALISRIDDATYENLGGILLPNGKYGDSERHHQFFCPNRLQDWAEGRAAGGLRSALKVGFQILVGRDVERSFRFERNDAYTPPSLAWASTRFLDQPKPGTIRIGGSTSTEGWEDIGLLVADINQEHLFETPGHSMSVSHGPRGDIVEKVPLGEVDIQKMDSHGGNLGYIDGSVHWRNMNEMSPHTNNAKRDTERGWW